MVENSCQVPSYFGDWISANAAASGNAKPDVNWAFLGTWHDSSYCPGDASPRQVEVTVVGTAVYAYFILDNDNITTRKTSLGFYLDDALETIFEHIPDPSSPDLFEYNALGITKDGLEGTTHTLFIQTTTNNLSLMLFDYVVYTAENATDTVASASSPGGLLVLSATPAQPSSSADIRENRHLNVDAFAGTVAGVAIVLAGISITILLYLRRKRRSNRKSPIINPGDYLDIVRLEPGRNPSLALAEAYAEMTLIEGVAVTRERHKSEVPEEERLQALRDAFTRRQAK